MGTVEVEITIQPKRRKSRIGAQSAQGAAPVHIPRIARLMALAIKFQELMERGEVRDYADLARLGYVTRPRITQIMNLLLLTPDIQESILFHSESPKPLRERQVRVVGAFAHWDDQRRAFGKLAPVECPYLRRPASASPEHTREEVGTRAGEGLLFPR